MKHIMYLLLGAVLLAGCLNNEEGESEVGGDSTQKRNISTRDNSISKTNSYSDLFFDSVSLGNYLANNNVPDSIGNRIISFYNARNYQFAWFTSDGFTEEAQAFWNLFDHYLTYSGDTTLKNKQLEKRMNRLLSEDSFTVNAEDKDVKQTEWRLTQSLIAYASKNFEKGYVKRKELERFVPFKKSDPIQLADSLLTKKHKDNKYFEDINVAYKALKGELQKYYDIHKQGGLPTIPTLQKPLKKGASAPQVVLIKQYLAKTGDMPAGDTSAVFNDTLAQGITSIQQRFGMKATGTLSKDLIAAMNVPVSDRIEQLLINLDRMRWMPSQPNGTLIVVNIPEFMLHVLQDGKKEFDMNVVVGKEGHSTMQFTGTMNQIVFAPYWNIPPNIVTKEIMPEIEKDAHYLEKNDMEDQGDKDGDGINDIRQLPGDKNALGKVKFLFPNSFDIYLHDTPAKSLFSKDKRAFSHGCIRLADAKKMAEYLLRNDPDWDVAKIDEAMNSKEQKVVKLKNKAEVFITYYTAWVDEEGRLNFRDDVYGHDKKVKAQLFIH
ncbi:murein L,D-transpeptidase [Niastella sp. OAS944]|uniref:L,D-transpeptidase family protein n=1 Tax=Niastella sp. OAS944 TaxID=2664089 RepID=UPI0034826642|nr:murein L,D-transpeptidase YcbB/YkuD [Chitinophagaceae bacterium OAS944]